MTKAYPHAPSSLQKSSPLLFLLHKLHIVPFLQGNLGEDILSRENPQGVIPPGVNLQEAEGWALRPSLDTPLSLVWVPITFFSHTPPMFPHRYLSGDGALDLSTRPRVGSYLPQNPTIKPFFINYFCSPKIFSSIVFFNEPSEYVFNMFSFIYTYNFFPTGLCY